MIAQDDSLSGCHDIAIIGAGPAGSVLAAFLARAGRRIVLLDKDTFPRDKLCGEFLSCEALSVLGDLGCLETILRLKPASITHARFTSCLGHLVKVALPGTGIGVSRLALDYILLRRAEALGVTVCTNTQVRQVDRSGAHADELTLATRPTKGGRDPARSIRARLVIGAYGRQDHLDRQFARRFTRTSHPFVGLKRHHRPRTQAASDRLLEEVGHAVEIHTFDGGYCGLNFIETGEVNICMLLEERFVRGRGALRWHHLMTRLQASNPRLRERLEALEPTEPGMHAVAQIPFVTKELSSERVLFVGDAAGMITPLCGDGQAMALKSAAMLSKLILAFPSSPSQDDVEQLGARWDSAWRAEFALRMRLGRWLQGIFLRPRVANAAAHFFNAAPSLAALMARATRGA